MALLLLVFPLEAAGPGDPPDEISLSDQGFGEQVVRGSSATLDMYFPVPGRYRLGERNVFILVIGHAEILDPAVSTATVFFNDIPLQTWFLTPQNARPREVEIPLPPSLIRSNTNHIQIKFIMRLPREACSDTEHPALTATVFRQTRMRYDYLPGYPRAPQEAPDLGLFPLTLLESRGMEPPRLALVVPDEARQTDLRTALNISAVVGRQAGGRNITMRLLPAKDAMAEVQQAHAVIIGPPSVNSLWDTSTFWNKQSLPLLLEDQGTFRSPDGRPIEETEGVIMDIPSPWTSDMRAVLITGTTEEAVLKAGLTLSRDTTRRALHGDSAVIIKGLGDVTPRSPSSGATRNTLADFTLADLGYSDRKVNGWGAHILTVSFDAPGVTPRGAKAKIFYDNSRVINPNISAMVVTLNDIPIMDTILKTDKGGRSTLDVELPARVLRAGRNSLAVRFYLAPQTSGGTLRGEGENSERTLECGVTPPDLAWGVLYSDSSIHLPPGGSGGTGLGSFPFPFVREGQATNTLFVLPDDLSEAGSVAELAAEFGRHISADVLDLAVTTAGR